MKGMIESLNALNTPWIALIVIILGAVFDLACKHFGLDSDAATGIIGAGIGLLTGQVFNGSHSTTAHDAPQPKEQ